MDAVGTEFVQRAGPPHQFDVVRPDMHQEHPYVAPPKVAASCNSAPMPSTSIVTTAVKSTTTECGLRRFHQSRHRIAETVGVGKEQRSADCDDQDARYQFSVGKVVDANINVVGSGKCHLTASVSSMRRR